MSTHRGKYMCHDGTDEIIRRILASRHQKTTYLEIQFPTPITVNNTAQGEQKNTYQTGSV